LILEKKRIGLAWVQAGLDVVLPFGVIDTENAIEKIAAIIQEEKIDQIVCGLPLGLDGTENNNTNTVRTFAGALEKKSGQKVILVDERFSSYAADRLTNADASRDERSAMIILQTFLEKK
jgi:putative Holliday junction resolvase